jgi:predicted  nucleic acid-binding Zn-ribbon protein
MSDQDKGSDRVRWDHVNKWIQREGLVTKWKAYGMPEAQDPFTSRFVDVAPMPRWDIPEKIMISTAITGAFFSKRSNPNQPITPDEIRASAEKKRLEAQSAEVERKKLELEAEAHRAKAARYKIQQFETRKNEEFAALGTEIQREEKEVQEIEDRELELMDRGEKAKKDAAVEAEAAKGKEVELTVKEDELKKKKTELETRLADLLKEIEALAGGVEAGVLAKYRRILANKKDTAVVPVVHETNCGGCHMKLTQGSALAAKGGKVDATCENWGRLIYWPAS